MIESNFDQVEKFLGRFVKALSPRERKRLASKIGQAERRENAKRIATNIEPDGRAMTPRKPRKGKKRGKMFRRLRQAKVLKVTPSADGVTIGFRGQAQKVAGAHHRGEVDNVGRGRDGRMIRVRYAQRLLLGVGDEDAERILEAVQKHLTPKA